MLASLAKALPSWYAEIRKLAEQSKASTKEIEAIIEEIREQSSQMVKQTSASVKGGVRQTNLIKEAISSSKEVFQRASLYDRRHPSY